MQQQDLSLQSLGTHMSLSPELRSRLASALRRPAAQQPVWPVVVQAASASAFLATLPPLVTPGEIRAMSQDLARVARGEAFVLQGGDCAETFAGNTENHLHGNVETLLRMGAVLSDGLKLPLVRIGRILVSTRNRARAAPTGSDFRSTAAT